MRGSTATSAACGALAAAFREQLVDAATPSASASCATRCRCRSSVVYTSTAACFAHGLVLVLDELLADVVDEVRRLARRARGRAVCSGSRDAWSAASTVMKPASTIARSTTLRRSLCALGVAERREPRRRLDDARNRRRLAERHVAGRLCRRTAGRLRPRRGSRTIRAGRASDVVQIQLEDLILGEPPLEHDRHDLLGELPRRRLRPASGRCS